MIQLSLGQYRSISEPFATLLSSNKVSFTEIPDSQQLQFDIDSIKLNTVFDIANYLSNNFSQVFTEPVNVTTTNEPQNIQEAIILAHSSILQETIEKAAFDLINSHLQQILNSTRSSFTIHEFILYETAVILSHLNHSVLEKYNAIEDLIAMFETTASLQPFLFSKQNLLKPFSKSIDNQYRGITEIVRKNINTLAEFAHLENAMYKYKHGEIVAPDHIPFSPLPLIIKREEFNEFYEKTELWNELLFKMTQDLDWLNQQFTNMNDPFLQGFLKIAQKARNSDITSKYTLGIIRNDVMHSASKHKWLQVEINTISISFGYVAEQVQQLQKTIKNSYLKNHFQEYECLSGTSIPVIVEGIAKANAIYGNPNAQVLIVISVFEGNEYDQRYPEYALAKDHGILTKRRTFDQLIHQATVDQEGRLFVEGDEISVVYFRTGYSPEHLPDEKTWAIREKIELTQAIKCPSVNLVLAGFKKLQRILQEPGQMQRFLSEEKCAKLKENFASIHDFEDESNHEYLISLTEQHPEAYVLKPQREGGDNNTYGTQIAKSLREMSSSDRKNYILMEKIVSKPNIALMIRQRDCQVYPSVSELGIISSFITDNEKIIYNRPGGYLVRTKRYFDDEGGVNAGYSVINGLMVQKVSKQ